MSIMYYFVDVNDDCLCDADYRSFPYPYGQNLVEETKKYIQQIYLNLLLNYIPSANRSANGEFTPKNSRNTSSGERNTKPKSKSS